MAHYACDELDAAGIVTYVQRLLSSPHACSCCPDDCRDALTAQLRGCHATPVAADSSFSLTATDLSDGNMNHVWMLRNSSSLPCSADCVMSSSSCGPGVVIVKQALPHVRILPSVAMTPTRAMLEVDVLRLHGRTCSHLLPAVLHSDHTCALLIQTYLQGFTVLRDALLRDCVCELKYSAGCDCSPPPDVCNALARYLTDAVLLPALCSQDASHAHAITPSHAAQIARVHGDTCARMCDLTRAVWFHSPYTESGGAFPHSRTQHAWVASMTQLLRADGTLRSEAQHTCDDAGALQEERTPAAQAADLHRAVAAVRRDFDTLKECVIHGDLHTGSMMVAPAASPGEGQDTHLLRIIDAEFGHLGWAAMDTGTVLAHFICAYMHATARARMCASSEDALRWWRSRGAAILVLIPRLWTQLHARITDHAAAVNCIDASAWMRKHARDSVRVAAVEIIRRVAGIARISDFNCLPLDTLHGGSVVRNARAGAEHRTLHAACVLLSHADALVATQPLACALDSTIACIRACDNATMLCTTPEDVAPLNFSSAVHVILVFKSPVRSASTCADGSIPYVPSVKTRLRAVPAFAARPMLLEEFATACVCDLVQRLSDHALDSGTHTILTLLHASPVSVRDAATTALRAVVDAAVPPSASSTCTRVYEAVDAPLSLTPVLSHACIHALRLCPAPVLLIGTDAPYIPTTHLLECVTAARRGRAHAIPAEDGGFTALGLPLPSLMREEAVDAASSMFESVRWSTHSTCASLCARMQACGIDVSVSSRLGRDIDDGDDWAWLSQACEQLDAGTCDTSDEQIRGLSVCARVRACVREVQSVARSGTCDADAASLVNVDAISV